MAGQVQRDEANGSRPVNSGSALSLRTAGGTEFTTNDPWTARIVVTAVSGVGIYLAKNLVTFLVKNPELVRDAIRLAVRPWGELKGVWTGSVIVFLDCGSQEKYLKFLKDFADGKVKDAMEEEFSKIGYNEKLQIALEERHVAAMEMTKESVIRETKKITFVNPNPVSHSNELKQEEVSVPAAKKAKLDPIGKPGTSGVSSTSETMKGTKTTPAKTAKEETDPQVKIGTPIDNELEELAHYIHSDDNSWKTLAGRLNIKKSQITSIDHAYKTLSEKAYNMLLHWKRGNGSHATYQVLYNALADDLVKLQELAQKYCCEN